MKKLLGLSVLLFSIVLLSGCGSQEKDIDDGKKDNIVKEVEKETNLNKEKTKSPKEYQMKVSMVMSQSGKNIMEYEYKIYKKNKDIYTEILKFKGTQDMQQSPVKPVASLKLGDKSYIKMDIKGKKYRFLSDGTMPGDQFGIGNDEMFDIESFKNTLKSIDNVKETKEEINGEDLVCYSFVQGGKIKTCLNEEDGYVAYTQTEMQGTVSKTSIYDFEDDVEDDVFETPTDVKPMSEIGKIMMGK